MDLLNSNSDMIPPKSKVHGNAPQSPPQTPNPFSDPQPQPQPHPHPDLLFISRSGTTLITNITKYLSTLPHPIEIVEELVAVCAVTTSLSTSLHSTLLRFPRLNLSPTYSFIAPLCHDILFAFKLLGNHVQEAKRMRVFEPNDVGLVRLPRAAWTLVLGTEAKVAALRSRLYVEKYRVRVFIEAVAWEGLRGLGERRGMREDAEWRSLKRMLPLVAERLVGVHRDYKSRLMRLSGLVVDEKTVLPQPAGRVPSIRTVVVPMLLSHVVPAPALVSAPAVQQKVEVQATQEPWNEKSALRQSSSSQSLASTSSRFAFPTPIPNPSTIRSELTSAIFNLASTKDSIHETWLLRCNRPKKDLKSRTSLFGIPLLSTHTYTAPTYYVKPSLSSASETSSLLASFHSRHGQQTESLSQHTSTLHQRVLSMPDNAQWEIQKLIEVRQAACSSENVCRDWELVGLLERSRRKLSSCERGGKWWSLNPKKQKKAVEWVLVLKGETVNRQERVLPGKHENAWKAVDRVKDVKITPSPLPAPAQVQRPECGQQQLQQGSVLRHIENRRVLSIEEAEVKMREIIADLFIQNEELEMDSEEDEGDEGEEIESDEDEDEEIESEDEVDHEDGRD